MISQIPTELVGSVIAHVDDRPTLHSLLVASRLIRSETERILYEDVSLGSAALSCGQNIQPLRRFHDTVTDKGNHRLTLYVRRFTFCLNYRLECSSEPGQLVDAILSRLVNLRGFVFLGSYSSREVPLHKTLHWSRPPFALKRFTWDHSIRDWDTFHSILSTHPSITHLEVRGISAQPLEATLLPNLHTLWASVDFTGCLPPDRRLLRWKAEVHGSPAEIAISDRVKEVIRSVRVFSIYSLRIPAFSLLQHMPDLEYFDFQNGRDDAYLILHTLLEVRTPKLKGLRISVPYAFDDWRTVEHVFLRMPTLQFIDFRSQYGDCQWERWRRGAPRAATIKGIPLMACRFEWDWEKFAED
ncbi:hypothetical protein PC9H_011672 [Pleurotus ostreatus]|uniref:Uncharacterized protein n=1 Tax=Pleurotus ostreatus TaxID=5322 RepID=A0A8H7DQS2_PLEOS|nr:uncharacterized protein PC9H_011672 [Pleurotus ostreatus]KAF7421152.1 hypothetical protein PC9H_011672 [Pleurotus ostreatus]KAJ8690689.1 hypothetical protein PTI98_012095 [Pleurotus ostreatus]